MGDSKDLPSLCAMAADEVYAISRDCLMAHSIRAVEFYVSHKLQKPHHIILMEDAQDFVLKKSWCAPGIPVSHTSRIWVDPSLPHDEKRFCIAHELYHIVLSVSPLDEALLEATAKECGVHPKVYIEHLSDKFARDLCNQHHGFYCDPKNIDNHCKFHNTNFQSLQGITL